HGYSFGGCTPRHPGTSPSSDHANLIPWIHWYNDHSLYSKDFQIQLHAEYATLLWPAVAFVVRDFDIEWTFFIAHCLTLLATFALLLLFGRAIASDDRSVRLSSESRFTWQYASQRLVKPDLLVCLFFLTPCITPGAEPLFDCAFYTRTAAFPLVLGA